MEEKEIVLEIENVNEINIDVLEEDITKVFPELEDLTVEPIAIEQNFKSKKYGFDNVTVKAVKANELNAESSTENQVFEGLFGKVNIQGIATEDISITPSANTQTKQGLFNKVTVAGDEDLKAENIKEGVTIFGIQGNVKENNIKITNATGLFLNNARLENIDEFLLMCENVTNMTQMFTNCTVLTELDLSMIDTSNVTSMTYLFSGCTKLSEVDFSNCNTNKVTSMANMFTNCKNLTELDFSSCDASKVANISAMFTNCTSLTHLNFLNNLGKGFTQKTANHTGYKLDLSTCTLLTHDSLMSVINNLYDLNLSYNVAGGGTLYSQQLILGSTNLAKLTSEEIAIATNKGWNVS